MHSCKAASHGQLQHTPHPNTHMTMECKGCMHTVCSLNQHDENAICSEFKWVCCLSRHYFYCFLLVLFLLFFYCFFFYCLSLLFVSLTTTLLMFTSSVFCLSASGVRKLAPVILAHTQIVTLSHAFFTTRSSKLIINARLPTGTLCLVYYDFSFSANQDAKSELVPN